MRLTFWSKMLSSVLLQCCQEWTACLTVQAPSSYGLNCRDKLEASHEVQDSENFMTFSTTPGGSGTEMAVAPSARAPWPAGRLAPGYLLPASPCAFPPGSVPPL